MKMFRYFLDDLLFDDPIGWDKWEETTKRDSEFGALFLTIDINLEFSGLAYKYMRDVFNLKGKDGQIKFKVEDIESGSSYKQIYTGIVFTSDIEWNKTKGSARVKIQDDSFYAKINNNKSIGAVLSAGKTKNGVLIDPARPYLITFKNVTTGLPIRAVYSIRIFELFKYLIKFMSDDTVEFQSDSFGIGGEWEGLCMTAGRKLNDPNPDIYENPIEEALPELNFIDTFVEINKKIKLGMAILRNNVNSKPIIVIEPIKSFYKNEITHEFENINDLIESVDVEKLYAKVILGNDKILKDSRYAFPEDINFFGFKDEEISILGTSNIDRELDLKSSWIISSNVIQLLTEDPFGEYDLEYDKDFVLLESKLSNEDSGVTVQTDYLGSGKLYFNPSFTNDKIISRWMSDDGLPNDIAKFIFPETSGFKFHAINSADDFKVDTAGGVTQPVQFDLEYFDDGSAYDNSISRFTATRGGLYTFEANVVIDISSALPQFQRWRLLIGHFDNAGFQLNNYNTNEAVIFNHNAVAPGTGLKYFQTTAVSGSFSLGGLTKELNLSAGDYVIIRLERTNTISSPTNVLYTITGGPSTFFKLNEYIISGDVQVSGNPSKYKAIRVNFESSLNLNKYNFTMANQLGLISGGDAFGNKSQGWIDQVVYNRLTSRIKVQLQSNQEIL